MNSIEHLRELFAYNDWANRRIVAAVRASWSDKARRILAHLLITESEYFARLHGKDSTGFDFWPGLTTDECSLLGKENAERFEKLLDRFDDEGLGLRTTYRTSEGVQHENTFRELLSHVLLHSATHRGNAVLALRSDGFEPPKVDYIIYLRENR
ncbi:MAG: DinB family protein [Pyrinomonadaceae bacterium]